MRNCASTLYNQLVQAIRCEQQVVWELAGQAFPELTQVFKDLGKATSRSLLASCVCAATIRQMTEEEFVAKVRVSYTGRKFGISKVRRAYQLAATSIRLTKETQAIQLAIQLHFSHLQILRAQLEQVINAMAACLTTLSEAPYLLSVTSLKAVTVALFLAEVGDPKHYHTPSGVPLEWVFLIVAMSISNCR